jgi:hypothetical protein
MPLLRGLILGQVNDKIFRPKKDVRRGWRHLHDAHFCNLCSALNVIEINIVVF